MHCVQLIKWKNTASDARVGATFWWLDKTMVLFSVSVPTAQSSVRAVQHWRRGTSLEMSGRARESLKEGEYFKGKGFT